MRTRPAAAFAWSLWLLSMAGIGIGLVLRPPAGGELFELIPLLTAFVAYATVGAVVASRRPRNPIGWVFLGVGILTAIGSLGESYSERTFPTPGPPPSLSVLAGWSQEWFWYPLFALSTLFTLLLFPSGLPSRRWRPVLWVSVGAVALATLLAALTPTVEVAGRRVPNPIGVSALPSDLESTPLFQALLTVVLLAIAAATVSVFVRFRRSRGEERQQLKWFAYSAALVAANIVASILVPAYERSAASQIGYGVVILGIPVSCGIAITKYRLFEIDRIINRTLVYGLVTLLLAAIYAGTVVGLSALVRSLTRQQNNAVVIAASTLAVAALFRPARRRVQGFIDRRFYRRRYDAARTLESFGARLRNEVDLDQLASDLISVVRETMQPAHASLWLRGRGTTP